MILLFIIMIYLLPEILHKLLYHVPINTFINLIQTNSIFLDILTGNDIEKIKSNSCIRDMQLINGYADDHFEIFDTNFIKVMFILPNGYLHDRYYLICNGKIVIDGYFRDNLRIGKWYYYIDEKIAIDGQYVNGIEDGWWYYYHNDKINHYGRFKNGFKVGYWSSYSTNGNLRSEFINSVIDNCLFSYYREWYNGDFIREGHLIDIKREGIWKNYTNGYIEEYYVNDELIS